MRRYGERWSLLKNDPRVKVGILVLSLCFVVVQVVAGNDTWRQYLQGVTHDAIGALGRLDPFRLSITFMDVSHRCANVDHATIRRFLERVATEPIGVGTRQCFFAYPTSYRFRAALVTPEALIVTIADALSAGWLSALPAATSLFVGVLLFFLLWDDHREGPLKLMFVTALPLGSLLLGSFAAWALSHILVAIMYLTDWTVGLVAWLTIPLALLEAVKHILKHRAAARSGEGREGQTAVSNPHGPQA